MSPKPLDDKHLRETCVESKELFKGRLLHAFRDTVCLPSGEHATREYIKHPGAVMVIPFVEAEDGSIQLVMERQYRYPVDRVMIEFPAGKLDPNEDVWVCAQRELREETGYTAQEWARAGAIRPVIAYSNEVIEVWFARHLVAGSQQLDSGEFLDVFLASPQEVLNWCLDGTITDAKTISGALWLQNYLAGQWKLDWRKIPA